MYSKKIFNLCLILFLSITLVGFGCKGLSQQEAAAVRPITLNYWTVYNDVDELKKIAEEYQVERPHVKVAIKQVRYEEFENLFVNALADDVGPDIVSIHTRWLKNYIERLQPMPKEVRVSKMVVQGNISKDNVVLEETNLMPTARAIKSNFVGTVENDAIINDNIYGIPLALDTLAIYYNKTLLDKAGIPEPPQDWAEFLKAVEQTTKFNSAGEIIQSGVALGTGKNIDNAPDILALLLLQNGVDLTRDGVVTFASGIGKADTSSPTLEALKFYTDFARPTKEAYSWNESMENALDAFARGKSVFYFGFAYDLPRIKTLSPQMELEVIPVPQLNEQAPVNVANYWIESVVKKTKHSDDAWDFVRFLTNAENIASYTKATNRPTPLRSQINDQKDDILLAPFVNSVLNAKNWYNGRNVDKAVEAIDQMISDYLRPYGEDIDGFQRDTGIVMQAAKLIQQTM